MNGSSLYLTSSLLCFNLAPNVLGREWGCNPKIWVGSCGVLETISLLKTKLVEIFIRVLYKGQPGNNYYTQAGPTTPLKDWWFFSKPPPPIPTYPPKNMVSPLNSSLSVTVKNKGKDLNVFIQLA